MKFYAFVLIYKIDQLKEDKLTLEQKLQSITEERDSLLTALSDTQQANALLQRENASQELLVSQLAFLFFSFFFSNQVKISGYNCKLLKLIQNW